MVASVSRQQRVWIACLCSAGVLVAGLVLAGDDDAARMASAAAFLLASVSCLGRARLSPVERTTWVRFATGTGLLAGATLGKAVLVLTGVDHGPWTLAVTGVVLVSLPIFHDGLIHWDRARQLPRDPHLMWTGLGGMTVVAAWAELWAGHGGPMAQLPLVERVTLEVPLAGCVFLAITAALAPAMTGRYRDPRTVLVTVCVLALMVRCLVRLLDPVVPVWAPALLAVAAVALGLAASIEPPRRTGPGSPQRSRTVTVTSHALLAQAVVVLAVSTPEQVPVAIGLALVTAATSAVKLWRDQSDLADLADARRQASTDELTGTANRRALLRRIEEVTARGDQACLAVLDVDDFGTINDGIGDAAGDELLVAVAARLQGVLQGTCLLGRIGGDAFAVVAAAPAGMPATDPLELGPRLAGALAEPFGIAGLRLHLTASIGLASTLREQGQQLFVRAEIALRDSRRLRSGPVVHDPRHHEDRSGTVQLVEELRAGLGEGQLVLFMQPQVSVRTGLVDGVEALVRWRHPQHGLLGPLVLVETAERHGLIGAVTDAVVGMAIEQLAAWRAEGVRLRVSVNLSATNLLDDALPERIGAQLLRHGIPAGELTLEITENVFVGDSARVRAVLDQLAALGCRLSIDDYGTGWSSLGYLRDLPIHELKLDRSFTAELLTDPRAAAIIGSTIDLAHTLGIDVVAEGVENDRTLALLTELGCDLSQGFWHARPMPSAEIAPWLAARRDGAASAAPGPVPDAAAVLSPVAG